MVYVASPLTILDDLGRLDRALGQVEERYPDARIIDGARYFVDNDHWRDWWPMVNRAMSVLVVVPAADMTVGTGVLRELADARRRSVTVEFYVDGAFLPDDGNVSLAKIEEGFTPGQAYRIEVS